MTIICVNHYGGEIALPSQIEDVPNYSLVGIFTGAICYVVFVEYSILNIK